LESTRRTNASTEKTKQMLSAGAELGEIKFANSQKIKE
jgi:hypothetical protein